jgi:hypothetical protein
MTWASTLISLAVGGLIFLYITALMMPGMYDPQQREYQQQCMERHPINATSSIVSFGVTECMLGTQYPEQLPDVRRNITVKTIQVLWLGDCKVLTSTGELLRARDDLICMSQPNDNLVVYQRRTIENDITDRIRM